jgi:gluconate 5-dehydrogenase
MSDVDGVRVLVTGGTSGLGLAMSAALVAGGARVALTGRDPGRATQVAGELAAAGTGQAIGVGMDVRDESSVDQGVASAVAALGGIDVLVNNAGLGMRTVNPDFLSSPQGFWTVAPEAFRDLFATNVEGYFLVARAVVPGMVAAGAGKVVNVSINESTMRRPGFSPYGPSRAATDALSHVMAGDLAGTGVTANLLAPGGAMATGMIPEDVTDEVRAGLLDPSIMGPPVCWLASRSSDGVNDARLVATDFAAGVRPRPGPTL